MESSHNYTEPVNAMSPPLDLARLKRDHGLHRAAQLLADATRVRQGLAPIRLADAHPDDREWFKQAARQMVEVFELVTQPEREPDAVVEAREMAAAEKVTRFAVALESRLLIERSTARLQATERGHDMSTWHQVGSVDGDERAVCTRCARPAYISIGSAAALSGSALVEGCIVAASADDPRRV